MYRCDVCGQVTEPGSPCNLIVETRAFEHPFRPRIYYRPARNGQKPRWDPDPGGIGTAIARERRACRTCHARALTIDRTRAAGGLRPGDLASPIAPRGREGNPTARPSRAELAAAFRACLSANRGADGRDDRYGIEVTALDAEAGLASLVLTFRAAEAYCCAEPGCHFPAFRRRAWHQVRAALAPGTAAQIPDLTVRVRGIVEAGARLDCLASFGLPRESPGYELDALWVEADAGLA